MQHQRRQKSPSSSIHQQDEDQQQQQQQQVHRNSDEASPSPGHLSWSPSPADSLVSGNERREIGGSRRKSPVPSSGLGSSISSSGSGLGLSSASSPPSRPAYQPQALAPGELDGTNLHEAEAAAARAAEAKARLAEAKVRSELAAREAKEAAEAAEVAREASTAVVVPLPATREEMTQDGRVGRRENAFLDTYFAFFGRFARLETESEARRTLIELSLLQDASPWAVDCSRGRRAASGGCRDGGGRAADEDCGGAGDSRRAEADGSGSSDGDAGGDSRGPRAPRGGSSTCVRRGVTPEKGASLWAGVGIGAMLQVRGVVRCGFGE